MKTDELREKYLAFFESKGCVRRPSDVLVPRWDPSVLFTPAGMNQFKDHFLGKTKLDFTRATTCQKCLRTGDIDNVGRTPYHHTFFEMLGNFSFGDYFKREAIHWAWEFLTSKAWLGLAAERLSVSVYRDDVEAARIWSDEIKIPLERIQRLGEDDNFWPAGAPSSGPDGVCGPCSEIFVRLADGSDVEIWNLVFTQFNRVGPPPNNLRPLPSKNIDTGMGLERTASVLQGEPTNFHIDILYPIVLAAAGVCGLEYDPHGESGRRLRRITDHLRACTFAVHEEVMPGPKKQGYVIKRLLRRAVLDGHQLGVDEPFLYKLVPVVADMMRASYPELGTTTARVQNIIREEEKSFFSTIDAGLERIERIFAAMKKEGREMVSGEEAAELYTTNGFPPELLETMAAEHNLGFDWGGFQTEMKKHGELSGAGERRELFRTTPLDPLKRTSHGSEFLGYETTEAEGKIIGLIARNELVETVDEVGHEAPLCVVLDRTPFYGEAGGQVGDTGLLTSGAIKFDVSGTQREGGFILHFGHLRSGSLQQGMKMTARVDAARRQAIRRAHSATHVLHHVLQSRLGRHAQQQGSKVDADWLRFDFANPSAVPRDLVREIEADVNRLALTGAAVQWRNMPLAQARETGAMMLFGEKYPDIVRVVSIGDFSKELCGGTHLDNSAQIGLFKIIAEESVSAGTRRITALTGAAALEHVRREEEVLAETAAQLRVPTTEVPARVAALVKEVKDLKRNSMAAVRSGDLSPDKLLADATEEGGVRIVAAEAAGADPNLMRQIIDQLRKTSSPVAVLLGSREADKVTLVAGISRDLEKRGVHAGNWIRTAAEIVGGRGGGKSDMAQAGGRLPDKLPEALDAARKDMEATLRIGAVQS